MLYLGILVSRYLCAFIFFDCLSTNLIKVSIIHPFSRLESVPTNFYFRQISRRADAFLEIRNSEKYAIDS